ncbi:MAG: exodeoxyribonuclease VII large subunit, partial [Christensenellales bacterium]
DFLPQNGMGVVLRGSAALYKKDGQFQIVVQTVQLKGQGDILLAFEQLKHKLEMEGLFDAARKRPLPFLPERLGVITSPTGAVIRDIINVANRRFPGVEIVLYPVKVQGEGAAEESVAALDYFGQNKNVDLIILGRGGGSMEELWAYNDEALVRAIAACPVPVISAVGHETDFTLADFAADLRSPTPSAAAELALPLKNDLLEGLEQKRRRLGSGLTMRLLEKRHHLAGFARMLATLQPQGWLQQSMQRLDALHELLMLRVEACARRKRATLGNLDVALRTLSPRAVLGRGYAIVRAGGAVKTRACQLEPGQEAQLIMQDGSAKVLVVEAKLAEKEGE